jgi:hypothetical protein
MKAYDRHQAIILETESWISSGLDFDTIEKALTTLRCPFQKAGVLVKAKQAPASDSSILAENLVSVLGVAIADPESYFGIISSLLGGISTNGSWRHSLLSEESTYELATALLVYSGTYQSNYPLDVHIEPGTCKILNEWLSPATPWRTVPDMAEILKLMAGEAWCDLCVPSEYLYAGMSGDSRDAMKVGTLFFRTRPAFASGLCPFEQDAMPLPEQVYP